MTKTPRPIYQDCADLAHSATGLSVPQTHVTSALTVLVVSVLFMVFMGCGETGDSGNPGIVCTDEGAHISCKYPLGVDLEGTIRIEGYDSAHWGKDENGENEVTPEMITEWMIFAQKGFESLSLAFEQKEPMTVRFDPTVVGLGSFNPDFPYVLRVKTEGPTFPLTRKTLRPILFHEYFHHAQWHRKNNNRKNSDRKVMMMTNFKDVHTCDPAGTPKGSGSGFARNWLTEGTAEWFAYEREISQGYDPSEANIFVTIDPFMEGGLNACEETGKEPSYNRSYFFSLVDYKCEREHFSSMLKNILMTEVSDSVTPPTGIKAFSKGLSESSCYFGEQLGASESGSLAAAVTYFNYATLHHEFILNSNKAEGNNPLGGKVSLLARGHSDCEVYTNGSQKEGTCFRASLLEFRPEFSSNPQDWADDEVDSSLHRQFSDADSFEIPPTGAISFSMPETTGVLPDGLHPKLIIRANGKLIISIAGEEGETFDDYLAGNATTLMCCDDSGHVTHSYGKPGEPLPRLFVTMYNPEFDKAARDVSVSFNASAKCPEVSEPRVTDLSAPDGQPSASTMCQDGSDTLELTNDSNLDSGAVWSSDEESEPDVPITRYSVDEYIIFQCELQAIPNPQTWGQLVALSKETERKMDRIEPPDVLKDWHELGKDAMALMAEIGEGQNPDALIDPSVFMASDKFIEGNETQRSLLNALPEAVRTELIPCL